MTKENKKKMMNNKEKSIVFDRLIFPNKLLVNKTNYGGVKDYEKSSLIIHSEFLHKMITNNKFTY